MGVAALAAILGISSKLGYLLPAIIGLESMGIPSPGETALVLAAVLASQGGLKIWLVILIGWPRPSWVTTAATCWGDGLAAERWWRPGRCTGIGFGPWSMATASSSATVPEPCFSPDG